MTHSVTTAEAAGPGPRADRAARLGPETVARLAAGGLARHFVPRRHGGTCGTFLDLYRAVAAEAETCASAAWCAVLWAWHARCAAMLPERGQAEIWSASPDALISAAIQPPAGLAEPVRGGWRLSGSWNRVSGAVYADWILLTAAEGPARPLVFATPAETVGILPTWDAAGLRATRTDTVRADRVFVPEHRTVPLSAFLDGLGTGAHAPGEPHPRITSIPAMLGGPVLLCAPALGSARAAVRAWAHGPGPRPIMAGRAERTAQAWCASRIETVGRLLERAARRADEGPVDTAAVSRARRDAVLAARTLRQVIEHAARQAGSAPRGCRATLERSLRDVYTATSHGALRPPASAAVPAARATRGALR
jgi:two-component flavin-dependent monooxygenase